MHIERAIILRVVKYAESSLIIHCLARSGSRLNLMAKGALKSRRRFGGGALEAFNYVQLTYKESKRLQDGEGPLHWLEEAQILCDFCQLRRNYDRLELGFYFLQVVSRVSRENAQDNKGIFDLLGNSLKALETTTEPGVLKILFELKFLYQQGVLSQQVLGYPLLSFPIQEHHKITLNATDMMVIQREVHQRLEAYLYV